MEIFYLLLLTVSIGTLVWILKTFQCETHNLTPNNNCVRSNNPVDNNTYPVQLYETLAEPHVFLPIYLEATRQHIENFNLQSMETQSLLRSTTLRNSTDSTQQQLPENGNSNVTTATTITVEHQTLRSPPSYDDVIRQSSITIPMEQHSFLLPSYDDFMRRNNQTNETS
jgi:hypothetical protein